MSTGSGLADFPEHPELAVSITLGTEHFSYGQTRLTMHGSGAVKVDNRRVGRQQQHADIPGDDRFSNERLDRLVRVYDRLVSRFTDAALPYGSPVTETE